MKSKKILPILLAAFSCLPYTSALESSKQKQSESKQKQAVVGSTNKNSDAKTINPLIPGSIGFVAGAASFGFGVGHFKNREIDKEKNQVTTLTNNMATLQTENNTLRQKNEKFESKLTEFRSQHPDIATGKSDEQLIDYLFKKLDNYAKVNKLYSKFIGEFAVPSGTANFFPEDNEDYPNGWDEDTQCSYVSVIANPEAFGLLNPENNSQFAFTARCQASLLEALFDPQPDPSTLIEANYLSEQAKNNEANIALKPKILKVN